MVITDAMIRVEGRGRTLRAILPSRSCALDKVCSARQRGTLVILYLPDDEWLTFPSLTKCRQIMSELKSRGVPTTQDA